MRQYGNSDGDEAEENYQEQDQSSGEDEENTSNAASYLCIQMEYCENRNLRKAIDSGDLIRNRDRMWKLFSEIVEGVAYFHSEGIMNRDLNVRES